MCIYIYIYVCVCVCIRHLLPPPCPFQWRDRGAALLRALPHLLCELVGEVATVKGALCAYVI